MMTWMNDRRGAGRVEVHAAGARMNGQRRLHRLAVSWSSRSWVGDRGARERLGGARAQRRQMIARRRRRHLRRHAEGQRYLKTKDGKS